MNIIAGIGLLMALLGFTAVYVMYAALDRPSVRYGYKIKASAFAWPWKMAWLGIAIFCATRAF